MGLSDMIQDILAARTKIKSKIQENKLQDEITKIAPVFQEPVVEQLQQTFFPQAAAQFPHTISDLPRIEAPRAKKRKIVDLDPDRGIHVPMLEMFQFKTPSQFLNMFDEPRRSNEIEGTVQKINGLLQSYGGKKSKGSPDFDIVIKHLRHYKESIKSLQKIPHFQVPSGMLGSGVVGSDKCGRLCQRLDLLIASRLAGNDNKQIVTEAKSILNLLLKDNLITRHQYSMILFHHLGA